MRPRKPKLHRRNSNKNRMRRIRSATQFYHRFHHLLFISPCQPHVSRFQSLSRFISFHLFSSSPAHPTLIFIWTSSSFFSSFEPGSIPRSLLVCISGACSASRFLCVHAFHPHVDSASLVHRSFSLSLSVFFLILLVFILMHMHIQQHQQRSKRKTKKPMLWLEEWMNRTYS